MRIERSQSITSPRYDLTSERARYHILLLQSAVSLLHSQPCQLVERKGHPTHECHSPTCQSLSLTHSFVHTHMIRCRCSTVRDDQHKPIQSRTGISIGIIITTSDYLRILTHTQSLLECLCIRLQRYSPISRSICFIGTLGHGRRFVIE